MKYMVNTVANMEKRYPNAIASTGVYSKHSGLLKKMLMNHYEIVKNENRSVFSCGLTKR